MKHVVGLILAAMIAASLVPVSIARTVGRLHRKILSKQQSQEQPGFATLSNKPVELRKILTEWRDAEPMLSALSERSPALAEAKPLAKDLGDLATAGLESISYLSTGASPPNE